MPKEKTSDLCPLCGNKVSPGLERCSVCGTPIRPAQEKADSAKPTAAHADDYLRKGLPKTAISITSIKCPLCAKELEGKESKCPRCGIPLVSKTEMLKCPECGSLAPQDARSCPSCGVGFEEAEAPRPAARPKPEEKRVPPPETVKPAPPRPVPAPSPPPVTKPQIVTAAPPAAEPPRRSEGLVNGRGSISGAGFVNGTGLVNGTGMTNGARFDTGEPARVREQKSLLRRWQFLAVLVAIVIVVPTFIYLSYANTDESMAVDGRFGDWSDAHMYTSYTSSASTTVNIDEWSVQPSDLGVYLYVKVQGAVMWGSGVSSFYLFIDSDDSSATGYSVAGMGADYLVELDGWDGEVGATAVYRYGATGTGADLFDWNKWVYISAADAAIDADKLEARADLPIALGPAAKYLLVSQDASANISASYPVLSDGGILVISQEPGSGVSASGTVPAGGNVAFMRLKLTCDGTGGTVESITPTVDGAEPGTPMSGRSIALGSTEYVNILVDTSSSVAGTAVSAFIQPSGVVSNFEEVIVLGTHVRAYVSAAPSTIAIDGAFGDWYGLTSLDGDIISLANPNTDIESVGAVNETTQSFFYVSVVGEICTGTYVPSIAVKPAGGGGGGGTTVLPRKGGEDILRVYIDSDLSQSTGYTISASGKTIGANYRIEIRGMFNQIVSESLYSYSAGSWTAVSGADITAMNDLNEMEIRIAADSISGASALEFVIETTDWSGLKDVATAVPSGTRAVQTMVNMISPESWIIDGGANAQATSMSYQRKLFYDGINIWSFYWDGTNTIYRYSTDGGQTWSATSRAFSTAGVNEASIWHDSVSSTVYIVGDRSTASRDVLVRKGTVAPFSHTITWTSNDETTRVSSVNLGGKNAYISMDAGGYVWVLSSNLTSTTPDLYQLSAFKTQAVGDITVFRHSGNMITGGMNNQPNVKGSIVPAGTGSDMWAVYMYSGGVYARNFTSSTWSAQSAIYTNTENVQNQDLAPASVVVDGSGVVHVVYGNGNEQPVGTPKPRIFYAYYSGSSWSVPFRLDSAGNNDANYYPTLSLDTSTGYLYAFWVYMDGPGGTYTVTAKTKVGGTWSSLTLPPQTTQIKQYLTSIYSAPMECYICWQWTQNTTAPIQLHFDKLPEFGTVVLPVFVVMVICMASVRLHRKRR